MCGISAVFDPRARGDSVEMLLRMHRHLAHRGPDGEGFLIVGGERWARFSNAAELAAADSLCPPVLSIAFRRLRIQDLSPASDQPLSFRDRRRYIVLNGEIYNFQELRRELEAEGADFRTSSDAEVALAAYDAWGIPSFERFDGMWALLIVDLEQGLLIGSRDRLGIKPLFFALDAGRLLLGSEPRALAAAMRRGPRLNAYRFTEFLRGLPPQSAELSFFEEVHPVPAATTFELDLAAPEVAPPLLRRFWDLADHHVGEDVPSYDEAGRTLGGLLCSAVSNQMVADVEVGSLLSGGLDSSLLTRIMVERGGNRGRGLAAYSIVYDDPEVDESRFSDAVVGEGGLRGLKERLNPGEAFRTCDQVVLAQGEPLLGYELIAQYHAFGLARRHGTRVVLDGQGADEILGGYPFYEGVRLRELLSQGALGQFWTELASLAAHHRRSRLSILRGHVLGSWRAKLPGARLPTYDWLDLSSVAAPDRGVATEGGPDRSALNRILYHQTKHTNLPAVLQHQDRNSMAHAVESRVPYLDHRIVEFCFRLPPSYKVALGERKRLLREVARPYLPEAILARKDKKAFVSTASWIRLRNQRDPLRGMLGDGALFELPWIRPGPLRRFVEDYLEGRHDDALAVWRLYTAWRWLELCRPGLP